MPLSNTISRFGAKRRHPTNKMIHIFLQYHEFKHMATAISDSDKHFSVCATWQCLMGPIRKAGSSLSASSGTHSGWPVPHCQPTCHPGSRGHGDLVFSASRTRCGRITGTSGSHHRCSWVLVIRQPVALGGAARMESTHPGSGEVTIYIWKRQDSIWISP